MMIKVEMVKEIFETMLKPSRRAFMVTKGVPEDAKLMQIQFNDKSKCYEMIFATGETLHKLGHDIPSCEVVFQTYEMMKGLSDVAV